MSNRSHAYLLRMEGVNLAAVLDDTADISIRRGAGLMLRQAVRDVHEEFSNRLRPVSLGASVGLFELETDDPDPLMTEVADFLGTHEHYRYLTFVVDTAPLDQGFPAALEQVTARNRLRQLRQPSRALPEPVAGALCCELDGLSPAYPKTPGRGLKEAEAFSPSALARFEYGRGQRNDFYSQELDTDLSYKFTSELSELAEPGRGQDFGNLNAKMAVIYLDGNGFGAIQRGCQTADRLRDFDRRIQDYRCDFLRDLIEEAGRGDAGFRNGDKLRLETLLWGGDEILLLVPAWKGMETLQGFYHKSADWDFDGTRLTHAGGLVFCHYKTPITQVIAAARDLAEATKQVTREENRFDYLVLESVDYPTQAPGRFRALRYGKTAAAALQPLAPFGAGPEEGWSRRVGYIGDFLAKLPHSAIHEVARAWLHYRNEPEDSAKRDFEKRVERMLELGGNELDERLRSRLFRYLAPDAGQVQGHDHVGWLRLLELWDYLAPVGTGGRIPS